MVRFRSGKRRPVGDGASVGIEFDVPDNDDVTAEVPVAQDGERVCRPQAQAVGHPCLELADPLVCRAQGHDRGGLADGGAALGL